MFPQSLTPIQSLAPATDAAGRTGKYVSLKNCLRAWILVEVNQGDANTVLLAPKQATAVAGTGAKALANVVPIWANADTANTANASRATDAVNYTTSAATTPKMVIFQIDPAQLDVANNFDCISLTTGASNVGNITSCQIIVEPRHKQATPPSVIAD